MTAQAALWYARHGWLVIPLHWPEDGRCSCKRRDCTSPGKHPLTRNGLKDASADPNVIWGWWQHWPKANVGIVTGQTSGLFVVDVDAKNGGIDSMAELPALPPTVVALTGGGGIHYFFRFPRTDQPLRNTAGRLGPGLDTRGEGGYVVAPPSRHISGSYYTWKPSSRPDGMPLADVPDWMLCQLIKPADLAGNADGTIVAGFRNDTLTSLGGTMHRRGMSEAAILAALLAENEARCVPPLPEEEVRKIAASVGRYPPSTSGEGKGEISGRDTESGPTPVLISLSSVKREEVEWRISGWLALGKLHLLIGDPEVGKSFVSLAIATAITTGASLFGEDSPRLPGRVLLLTAEDGLADTVVPRLEDMGADLTKVVAWDATKDEDGQTRPVSLIRDMAALEKALSEGDFALVLLDPLNAYLAYLDTHKDSALRAALTPLADIAERYHVAIISIGHLTKSRRDKALYRGQGSIAYTAAARLVHLVGITENGHRAMVCIKSNLGEKPPPVGFEIKEGVFFWLPETPDVTPAQLLAPEGTPEEASAKGEAVSFLQELLAGGPVPVAEIKREAEAASISFSTLTQMAKPALGAVSRKVGFGKDSVWMWELPPKSTENAKSTRDNIPVSLGDVVSLADEAPQTQRKGGHLVQAIIEMGGRLLPQGEAE